MRHLQSLMFDFVRARAAARRASLSAVADWTVMFLGALGFGVPPSSAAMRACTFALADWTTFK